jgi:hypothetical protein
MFGPMFTRLLFPDPTESRPHPPEHFRDGGGGATAFLARSARYLYSPQSCTLYFVTPIYDLRCSDPKEGLAPVGPTRTQVRRITRPSRPIIPFLLFFFTFVIRGPSPARWSQHTHHPWADRKMRPCTTLYFVFFFVISLRDRCYDHIT